MTSSLRKSGRSLVCNPFIYIESFVVKEQKTKQIFCLQTHIFGEVFVTDVGTRASFFCARLPQRRGRFKFPLDRRVLLVLRGKKQRQLDLRVLEPYAHALADPSVPVAVSSESRVRFQELASELELPACASDDLARS